MKYFGRFLYCKSENEKRIISLQKLSFFKHLKSLAQCNAYHVQTRLLAKGTVLLIFYDTPAKDEAGYP